MNVIQANLKYNKPLIPLDIDGINYIIIHHPEASFATPEQIHEWHIANGWNGAGYNEYIKKDGTVYILRGDNIGAQSQGYNSISYGICCEGNYDIEIIMPELQKRSLIERIKFNRARFKNLKGVVPHWQFNHTSCPGKYFPMAELLKRIEVIKVTLDEAIKLQVEEGVINSPDYRYKVCDTTIHEKDYVINVSKKLLEKNEEIARLKLLIK